MIRFLVKCRLFRTDIVYVISYILLCKKKYMYTHDDVCKSIQTISILTCLTVWFAPVGQSVCRLSQIMMPLFNNYLEQWLLLRSIWTLLIYRSSRSNLCSSFKVLLVGILLVSLLGNYKLLEERSVTKIFGKSWRML